MKAYWLEAPYQALRQARAQQRFPHALLIHDLPGGGGDELALQAARVALCREPDAPCGRCRNCLRVDQRQHPDLYWISPIDDARNIAIDQIRQLSEQLAMTSHEGGGSVAILHPADAMLPQAANALLKTLEEPRSGVTIILHTASPARLLPTLLSRCMRLKVRVPAHAEIIEWLRREQGEGDWESVLAVLGDAPLLAATVDARALSELRRDTHRTLEAVRAGAAEPGEVAARWARQPDYGLRLACVENWITVQIGQELMGAPRSMAQSASKANSETVEVHRERHLPAPGAALKIAPLIRLHDSVRELALLAATPLNKSLGVEQLLWQVLRGAKAAA
jgi:DNA polymerase-3 subunit delta'